MNTKKVSNKEPCIPLPLAKSIIGSGKKLIKQSEDIVKHLSEMGVDVSELEAEVKHEKAAEKLAGILLKEAQKEEKSR